MSQGGVILSVAVMYIILGIFFDGISMMIITIPFVAPILKSAGVDLIWFGVFLTVLIEVGFLTPPVGLNLYVMKGVTRAPVSEVIRGAVPFMVPMLMLLVILVFYPGVATWLPSAMGW